MNKIIAVRSSLGTNHSLYPWIFFRSLTHLILPVDFPQDGEGTDVDCGFCVELDVFQDGFGYRITVDAGKGKQKGFGEGEFDKGVEGFKV